MKMLSIGLRQQRVSMSFVSLAHPPDYHVENVALRIKLYRIVLTWKSVLFFRLT